MRSILTYAAIVTALECSYTRIRSIYIIQIPIICTRRAKSAFKHNFENKYNGSNDDLRI